jgi:topoisomerase IV subunit A
VKEIEPVIKDEDDKPSVEEEEEQKPNDDFDDVPFEVKRPGKEDDPSQMSLF